MRQRPVSQGATRSSSWDSVIRTGFLGVAAGGSTGVVAGLAFFAHQVPVPVELTLAMVLSGAVLGTAIGLLKRRTCS